MQVGSTVAAVASPPGKGARAVLRVSGPEAGRLVRAVWKGKDPVPAVRGMYFGRFDDGRGTQPLMLLWMPGPHSYTREDVAEFHLPGSPPLVAAALERLIALGAAAAPPGEFTRRAFLNGRLDLTRAEGVLSLVTARSEGERRAATMLLGGGLEERIGALRAQLDALRALCEASLDFDETDTGHVPEDELLQRSAAVQRGLHEALDWERAREPERGLPQVVLVGSPNAGKSRLFNRLVGGEAIVSTEAGTTRDALRGTWSVGASEVELWDTAGVEDSRGVIELSAQGIGRRLRESADLRLWVVDGSRTHADLSAERAALGIETGRFLVWNQVDRADVASQPPDALIAGLAGWAAISAETGAGIEELEARVERCLGLAGGGGGEARELSARHRAALQAAIGALEAGLSAYRAGTPLELLAENLREATAALDQISGRTTPEDLLDRIFGQFCIGK